MKMTRNPFCLNKDILFEGPQEKFSEMKCNTIPENNFEAMSLIDFWEKYVYMSVL